jgi:N-methylhydantoinase A
MRYGNQRVQTTVTTDLRRLTGLADVAKIIAEFHRSYGDRFGEGSQSPAAGVRINTVRVCSHVELDSVQFKNIHPGLKTAPPPKPVGSRKCHFVGHDGAQETAIYDASALVHGVQLPGPAVVTTPHTTYLAEPGWRMEVAAQGAVWFVRNVRESSERGNELR